MTISFEITKLIASVITISIGLLGAIAPASMARMVSLKPIGNLGLSEIRTTYGGLFTALGTYVLWHRAQYAYEMAAVVWAAFACVRLVSVIVDNSRSARNLGTLALEAGVAILFIW